MASLAREGATRVDGLRDGDVRAAVGSLAECGFTSLRSAMPSGGGRAEPLRHLGCRS